jgi:acyl-coenzyme A synthetase/AMP-(fatty) acid ligase
LAHFKVPYYFEFVKELPKNRVGKIDKQALQKMTEQQSAEQGDQAQQDESSQQNEGELS